MVTPSRLRLARERQAMTLAALAHEVGLSSKTLSGYEKATTPVADDMAARLAGCLRCRVDFLCGPELELIPPEAASFRARRSLTAGQAKSALAAGRIGIDIMSWIEQRFSLPEPDVPTLNKFSPEEAASLLRHRWGLGNAAAPNMVHLLEAHGVRVLSLPIDTQSVDAFSIHWHGVPFVFLTVSKSAERGRFDAAHELGHLVLHATMDRPLTTVHEADADRFAAAFLMPREGVIGQQLTQASARVVIHAKRMWGVAAMALARRLYELEQLTEWEYRLLCVELSKQGYRRAEGHGIARETSLTFRKVLGHLRAQGVTPRDMSRQMLLTEADLYEYTFGLVVKQLPGEGRVGPSVPIARAELAVVPSIDDTLDESRFRAHKAGR